jgi:hypothetical protein
MTTLWCTRRIGALGKFLDALFAITPKFWIGVTKRFEWTGYMSRWTYFKDEEVIGLEPEFVAKLELARKAAGIPFIITCGKRTQEANATVGGVQDSAHLRGRGVDLHAGDSQARFRIVKGAIVAGFVRIGIYTDGEGNPTHVHLDDDMALPQEVMWNGVSH